MEFNLSPRPSPIAGTWYSSNPRTLGEQVDDYIEAAVIQEEDIPGKVVAIISPHAGYRYSGRTAGYAYRAVKETPRNLAVILSPLHAYASGDFITTNYASYKTPLGEVAVAVDLLNGLEANLRQEGIILEQIKRDEEHSLEIQLPFLQRAWSNGFQLLPIMVRCGRAETIQTFAQSLFAALQGNDYLLIASTDLSHFHPLSHAEQLDAEMLRRIKALDPLAVLGAESERKASACGAGAVAAVLWASEMAGADYAGILNYSTSADVTGDTSSVVGYGAAVLTKIV